MAILLSNNAEAPLAGGIDATQTTIAVSSGQGALFPSPTGGDWTPLTLTKLSGSTIVREIMRMTGRVGDTLTVVRGQEGTTATTFTSGAVVSCRMTAGAYAGAAQVSENLSDMADTAAAFSNIKQAASETVTGVVEKATTAESQAGTAADKFPDVVGVKAAIDAQALRKASNLSDVASAVTAFTNIKQAASETATGVVEKATTAESQTGTAADKYPDVVGVKAAIDAQALRKASNLSDVGSASTAFTNIKQAATETATGVVEKATTVESQTGTAADRFPDVVGVKAAIDAQALRQSSNLSDVGSAATAFTNIKQAATTTSTGVVEKATNTEATTGTAADKFPDVVGVKAAIDAAIAALVDGAPGTIDTLNELAAALGDDPNFATTVTNSIATKLTASLNLSDLTDDAIARTNLGLGTVAIENTVPVAKGGTGSTTASGARTNLGLGAVAIENTVPISKGGTGTTTATAAFTALKQAATETVTGVVEKATTVEAQAGTAADKFPDVVGVKAAIDQLTLRQANNLSDLPNTATARTNLDVYSKADTMKVVSVYVSADATTTHVIKTNGISLDVLSVTKSGVTDGVYFIEFNQTVNDPSTHHIQVSPGGKIASWSYSATDTIQVTIVTTSAAAIDEEFFFQISYR